MNRTKSLQLLKRAAGRGKNVIPVLTHAYIDGIEAKTTDLGVSASVSIGSLGLEVVGSGCVPVAYLEKAIKAGAHRIEFGQPTGGTGFHFKWERGSVAALPADDFPVCTFPAETNELTPRFFEAYNVVKNATTADDARYSLNGVAIDNNGTLIASDGHRLHVAESGLRPPARTATDAATGATVDAADQRPRVIPAALLKITPNVAEGIGFNGETVAFHGDSFAVSGRLIEGNFPKWEKVIPKSTPDCTLTYDAEKALQALDRLKGFKEGKRSDAHPIRLSVDGTELALEYRGESTNATEKIDLESVKGELGETVGINLAYLADAVRAVGTGTLQFSPKSGNYPGPIMLQSEAGKAVIMPMRV